MNQRVPSRNTIDERWNETFLKVKKFVEENERLPSNTTNQTHGELRNDTVGYWIRRNRENFSNNQLCQLGLLNQL